MARAASPKFMLVSECVARLVQAMWGNLPRPQPVADAKKGDRDLSVGFGPQREESKALLRSATLDGSLRIYVRQRQGGKRGGSATDAVQIVPPEILVLIIPVRGGFPDHPTHLVRSSRAVPEIFAALQKGELVVRRSEFEDWLSRNRRRGIWPSHRQEVRTRPRASRRKRVRARRGRPSTAETFADTIIALVNDGLWTAAAGIPALARALRAREHNPPSRQTLARLVDQQHRATGDPALRRPVRKPPSR